MGRVIVLFVLVSCYVTNASCQHTVTGRVINERLKTPVPYAIVTIKDVTIWADANEKGEFSLRNVPNGENTITIQYLGYVKATYHITVLQPISNLVISLKEDNLAMDEVLVIAKQSNDLGTSFVMDRTVLDHMQMLNVTDVASLLPGRATNTRQHLATSDSQAFSINGSGSEEGNALFGVGVEIDGVRLSNNAIPNRNGAGTATSLQGSDVRNIATANIESIEIITGVPSVEHGDVSNGVVKINTRKGASPFILDLVTKPHTKQLALSKGIDLGGQRGVLNTNIEHTRSISNLASPYTSYDRNGLSLNYSNTFNQAAKQPLKLNIGIIGNIGGYDQRNDPDQFVDTYSKMNDKALRANLSVSWLLNKPWITTVEVSGALNYNNRTEERSVNQSASSSVAAIHTMAEGYFVGQRYSENPNAEVLLLDPGYWYQLSFVDSRLFNYTGRLKANWGRRLGIVNNNLLVGAEYSYSTNLGRGLYYDDMRYAPTWREYRYDELSGTNNYAFYAEDRVHIPINRSNIQLVAGVRTDITSVQGSEYGTVSNFSPRFNLRYTFWEESSSIFKNLSFKYGLGKTVKLPPFTTLFPALGYRDILSFAPGTTATGQTYYAYYTMPTTLIVNPDLKWQSNVMHELSLSADIAGTNVTLIYSRDKTINPYSDPISHLDIYAPFTYKLTSQVHLENSAIPIANRLYTIDQQTGVVTVADNSGDLPTETLGYQEVTRFISNTMPINESPVYRNRFGWIVDFKKIEVLKTSFRVDGNFYNYKNTDEVSRASTIASTITMADGSPYKYVGFYPGGSSFANGRSSKTLNMNLTATTHIPAIRLIISARIETSLYTFSQNLSEYNGTQRGFVIDSRDDYEASNTVTDLYSGDQFMGLYPDYYVSIDDLNTPIPFAETFLWAKDNDRALYNELAKMVIKSYYSYYYNPNRVSAYYSANLGVTKEIGNIASITFSATNVINNLGAVRSSWNDSESSLYNSSRIPNFYYGISLKLKL